MVRPGLKLLYVSQGYTTHDRRFLQLFGDGGLRVCHLPLEASRLDRRGLPAGVESVALDAGGRPLRTRDDFRAAGREMRELLDGVGPDVVLAGPVPTAAFRVALAGFRPLIAMSWGSDLLVEAQRPGPARFAARYALRRSAAVFGDCAAVLDAARSLLPPYQPDAPARGNKNPLLARRANIPARRASEGNRPPSLAHRAGMADDQLLAFPWGIDVGRFSPGKSALDVRQRLGWTRNPVFLSTRTWEPIYAIDVLVKAFAMARAHRPEARLILLGDGSLAPEVNALIDVLGIREHVHAPGRVGYDCLPEYFRLADCYVSSALSDGTSVSLLEAMACGLPAIVTEGYGNLEWVVPGVNGWLAEPGNAEALAGALLRALDCDPARRAAIREANVATIRARADWNKNSPRLLHLIEKAGRGEAS